MTEANAGAIVQLPLSQLIVSKQNPRKSKEETADVQLMASIKSRGLLQNLGVRQTAGGKYEVLYGGRRLAALRQLTKDKHFAKDAVFPCRIVPADDGQASEEALAENIARAALSPSDEFEAFAKLEAAGLEVAAIAERFGATEKAVRQRLSLGKAAPCVRKALRDGEISLDVAKAFAGCPDMARQERVFKTLNLPGYVNDYTVKRSLYDTAVKSSDNIARFVGLEAYEAAGGKVERDLFDDEAYLGDGELLLGLRDARLAEEVERLRADGWAWVEAHEARFHDYSMTRLAPKPVAPPPEVQAEIDTLVAEQDGLVEKYGEDDENWNEEDYERYAQIEDRIHELQQELGVVFTDEQKAVSGCIIYPAREEIGMAAGLVRESDRQNLADVPGAPDQPDKKPAPAYSQRLLDDMAAYKAQSFAATLSDSPEIAGRMHQFILVASVLSRGYGFHHGTTLKADTAYFGSQPEDIARTKAAARLSELRDGLRLDILETDDIAGQWTAFKALDAGNRDRLVAFALASSVEAMAGATTLSTIVAHELDVNARDHWDPTDENYFSRIKKDQLIDVLTEIVGTERTLALTNGLKIKKAELVALCHGLVDGTAGEPAEQAKAAAWIPPTMRFEPPEDAGRDDDNDPGDHQDPDGAGEPDPIPDKADESDLAIQAAA